MPLVREQEGFQGDFQDNCAPQTGDVAWSAALPQCLTPSLMALSLSTGRKAALWQMPCTAWIKGFKVGVFFF